MLRRFLVVVERCVPNKVVDIGQPSGCRRPPSLLGALYI